ncbi:MAG TPA: hypothetical protein VFS56_11135 [Gemmatimonadaceae bacterium]|nr:hypothetical protein [Gemmatimonadaceae bacterium]
MVRRRGISTLGCLLPLLLLAAAGYFAYPAAEAYFRFYKFKDAMGQEARFATTQTDEHITRRLVALADSLEMPPGAELITIERGATIITISADYHEVIPLPFDREKVLHFHPLVRSRL